MHGTNEIALWLELQWMVIGIKVIAVSDKPQRRELIMLDTKYYHKYISRRLPHYAAHTALLVLRVINYGKSRQVG